MNNIYKQKGRLNISPYNSNIMYKQNKMQSTSITRNTSTEGERIEQKIARIINNKEPLTEGSPIIYTERKDGVHPGMDIRTDRFDVALDATNLIAKDAAAKRAEKQKTIGEQAKENMSKEAGGQSTEGTGSTK